MSKVYAIGEVLIDFIPGEKNCPLKEVENFRKMPGGGPANVACCVSKLGGKSSVISKLGNDAFGHYLLETLQSENVEVNNIILTDEANTALAFVSLDATGERDFSFYRNPSADMLLTAEEVDVIAFEKSDFLHFCSVDLIEAPVKYAHIKAIENAKRSGSLICFDPNIRLPLWASQADCVNTIKDFLHYADILKISEDEVEMIFEGQSEESIIKDLLGKGVSLILMTRGSKGVHAYTKNQSVYREGFKVDTVDTTGAGDSFIGSILYQLQKKGLSKASIETMSEANLEEILRFSNAVGALTTTRYGAISAIPVMSEVEAML